MKDKTIIRKATRVKKILKGIALGSLLWSVASTIYAGSVSIWLAQ
jgi:hypothetical protein